MTLPCALIELNVGQHVIQLYLRLNCKTILNKFHILPWKVDLKFHSKHMNMVRNEQLNDRGYVECPHDSHMIHLNLTIVLHHIHLGNIAKKTETAGKKVRMKTETHLANVIVIPSGSIVWIVEYSIVENHLIGSDFY